MIALVFICLPFSSQLLPLFGGIWLAPAFLLWFLVHHRWRTYWIVGLLLVFESVAAINGEHALVVVEAVLSGPPERLANDCAIVLRLLSSLVVDKLLFGVVRANYPSWHSTESLGIISDGFESRLPRIFRDLSCSEDFGINFFLTLQRLTFFVS